MRGAGDERCGRWEGTGDERGDERVRASRLRLRSEASGRAGVARCEVRGARCEVHNEVAGSKP